MKKLFVYLASRSKAGIKLITTLKGDQAVNSTLDDLSKLKLPPVWERQIKKIIHDNRFLYEARIESASDYNELRERLKNRGFKDLPMGANTLLRLGDTGKAPQADTSSCNVKRTMIRKRKD
jgi:hypothetical protein